MDKYELIEVLRAAADGIAGTTKSKEAELKLDCFRRIVYNLCKCLVAQEFDLANFSSPASFDKPDPLKNLYICVSKFDQTVSSLSFTGKELLDKANKLYKQLTNEDPPKED